jgi:hypothetical protein
MRRPALPTNRSNLVWLTRMLSSRHLWAYSQNVGKPARSHAARSAAVAGSEPRNRFSSTRFGSGPQGAVSSTRSVRRQWTWLKRSRKKQFVLVGERPVSSVITRQYRPDEGLGRFAGEVGTDPGYRRIATITANADE